MFFLEHFNILLGLYKFIGLAPISKKAKKPVHHFVHILPIVLSSLSGLCIATFLLVFPHFESFSPIHTIINFASQISFLLILFSANCQCYCYKSIYQTIIYHIRQIEKRGKEKFWYKLPVNIKLRYILKAVYIFSLFFLSQGLVFTEVLLASSSSSHVGSSFLTSLLRLISPLAALHVILFGDIVTMFILEINEQIRNLITFSHSSVKIEFLRSVKLMHMDLWKLVTQINIFFGWNLLFIIINSFIYITYQLYWIFLALELKWSPLALIEGSFSLLYGMTMLFILVNSCQSSTLKLKYLIEAIELYAFWASDNVQLHQLKQEIFSQMNSLPIYITGSGFFTIDRQYLAGIAASCCMYIIIFIQFFVTADV